MLKSDIHETMIGTEEWPREFCGCFEQKKFTSTTDNQNQKANNRTQYIQRQQSYITIVRKKEQSCNNSDSWRIGDGA